MKSFFFTLSLLASAAVGVFAAEEELKIDVTAPVECERKTQNGDKIQVHYRGTLQSNGQKFDASYDRGQPFSFKLGQGQVIKGWDEGFLGVCIGQKQTLTIPPSKGYGNRGMGPIPAGSTLIFETELIGIDGVPKPETIIYKTASETASSTKSGPVDSATEAVGEKIANKVGEAAEVVKTIIADSDDGSQDHNEL